MPDVFKYVDSHNYYYYRYTSTSRPMYALAWTLLPGGEHEWIMTTYQEGESPLSHAFLLPRETTGLGVGEWGYWLNQKYLVETNELVYEGETGNIMIWNGSLPGIFAYQE